MLRIIDANEKIIFNSVIECADDESMKRQRNDVP